MNCIVNVSGVDGSKNKVVSSVGMALQSLYMLHYPFATCKSNGSVEKFYFFIFLVQGAAYFIHVYYNEDSSGRISCKQPIFTAIRHGCFA